MFSLRRKQQTWDDLPSQVQDQLTMLEIPGIEPAQRLAVLQWVASKYPRYLLAQLNLALALLSSGRQAEAEKLSRLLAKSYPDEKGPIAGLALVLAEAGKLGEAETLALEAINSGYRWSPCLGVVAQACEARGDLEGAANAHLGAYELTPHSWNHLERYCAIKNRPFHAPVDDDPPEVINHDQLADLISSVSTTAGCDNTLSGAKAWALHNGVDPVALYQFLNAHSGFCDCEIGLNVSALLNSNVEESDA